MYSCHIFGMADFEKNSTVEASRLLPCCKGKGTGRMVAVLISST